MGDVNLSLKNALVANGLWADLSAELQSRLERGETLPVENLRGLLTTHGLSGEALDVARSKALMLRIILAGGNVIAGTSRFARPPDRGDLILAIKTLIRDELESSERRRYYGAVTALVNRSVPESLLSAIYLVMGADIDEGLDLLEEVCSTYDKLQGVKEVGDALLRVAHLRPEVAGSFYSGLSALSMEHHKRFEEAADAFLLLYGWDEQFARDFFDGLHGIKWNSVSIVDTIARVAEHEQKTAHAILGSMKEGLQRFFIDAQTPRKRAWSKDELTAFELRRSSWTEMAKHFSYLRRYHGAYAKRVLRKIVSPYSNWERFKRFLDVGHGEASFEERIKLTDRLMEIYAEGNEKGIEAITGFRDVWGAFISPLELTRYITASNVWRLFGEGSADLTSVSRQLSLSSFILAPKTKALFEKFMGRVGQTGMRLSPSEYLSAFWGMLFSEVHFGEDPLSEDIDWTDVLADIPVDQAETFKELLLTLKDGLPAGAPVESQTHMPNSDGIRLAVGGSGGGNNIPYIAKLIIALGKLGPVAGDQDVPRMVFDQIIVELSKMPKETPEGLGLKRGFFLAAALGRNDRADFLETDILPFLQMDLGEVRRATARGRGMKCSDTLRLYHILGHPQVAEIAEMFLADLLTPPSVSVFRDAEQIALIESLDFVTQSKEILDSLTLSERGAELLHDARTKLKAHTGLKVSEAAHRALSVDVVFYGATDDASPLALESGSENAVPALGARAVPAKTDPPPGSDTLALALADGGTSLAKASLTADPHTGLAVIKIGDTSMPLWRAVAPIRASSSHGNRRDWQRRAGVDASAARVELGELQAEKGRIVATAMVPRAADHGLALSRLDKLRGLDSVGIMLERSGNANIRQDLIDALADSISFDRGLAMLELALRAKRKDASIKLHDVEDAAKYLPNITSLEIAMLSLCQTVPRLLLWGEGLSMIYSITPLGIEWANDGYEEGTARQGLYAVDPYTYAGITGKNEGTNFTPFSHAVTQVIFGIIRSGLTDRFFFDELWKWHYEAAQAGLSMLKEDGDPRFLLNKEIVDMERDRELDVARVAKLVGLLSKIPDCLNRPDAARIYFKPFAAGILFADQDGNPIEYVGYHAYIQTSAFQDIYYKVENDLTDHNPVLKQLVGRDVLGAFYAAAFSKAGDKSTPLERKIDEIQAKYGIALSLPHRVASDRSSPFVQSYTNTKSLKMDVVEVGVIDDVLSHIPPHVLSRARKGIGVIRKALSKSPDVVAMSQDSARLGEYDPYEKAITMYHFQEEPYRKLSPMAQQVWRETVLHEVGEAIFDKLSRDDLLALLSCYPWRHQHGMPGETIAATQVLESGWFGVTPDIPDDEFSKHFLTSYSSHEVNDMFAEGFMAYIFHGPEFREMAKNSEYLQNLYSWFETRIFTNDDGGMYHFEDTPKFTLRDLGAQVQRWRLEYHQRKEDHEGSLRDAHEAALNDGTIAATVGSVEWSEERRLAEDEDAYLDEIGVRDTFAAAYYELSSDDEKARRASRFEQRIRDAKDGDAMAPVIDISHAFADSMEVDDSGYVVLDEDGDEIGDRYEAYDDDELSADFRNDAPEEVLAMATWAAMSEPGNTLRDVLTTIESAMRRYEGENGVQIQLAVDEDFVRELVSIAARAVVGDAWREVKISAELSDYVLPGQYDNRTIVKIAQIMNEGDQSLIEGMSKVFAYLCSNERLSLTSEDAALLTKHLFTDRLSKYEFMKEFPVEKVILKLQDEGVTVYSIAEELGVKPGRIDAFAEVFMGKTAYSKLEKRSRVHGTLQDLRRSHAIHVILQTEFEHRYGEKDAKIEAGMERIEKSMGLLQDEGVSALDKVREILGNGDHMAHLMEVGRELSVDPTSGKPTDDDDDDDDKGPKGGPSGPGGGGGRPQVIIEGTVSDASNGGAGDPSARMGAARFHGLGVGTSTYSSSFNPMSAVQVHSSSVVMPTGIPSQGVFVAPPLPVTPMVSPIIITRF